MRFLGRFLDVGMAAAQQQTSGRTHASADQPEVGRRVE
jgi:hypothetical protein